MAKITHYLVGTLHKDMCNFCSFYNHFDPAAAAAGSAQLVRPLALSIYLRPLLSLEPRSSSRLLFDVFKTPKTNTCQNLRTGLALHRKWNETNQQLISLPHKALLGCCSVSLHIPCSNLATLCTLLCAVGLGNSMTSPKSLVSYEYMPFLLTDIVNAISTG